MYRVSKMSPSWDLSFSQYLGTHGPKIGYFPKSFGIKDLYFFSLTHLMCQLRLDYWVLVYGLRHMNNNSDIVQLILISWGWPHKSNFFSFYLQWANLIGPLQKNVESVEVPQNKSFYGKMKCPSLWPSYIGEKGRTLGKTYGIKARCYWEHP